MSQDQNHAVIVSGATSIIGKPLLRLLKGEDLKVFAVSRHKENMGSTDGVLSWDLATSITQPEKNQLSHFMEQYDSVTPLSLIHCAPIWLLSKHIDSLAEMNVGRIIAFSSTSVEGKATTDDPKEQEIVQLLLDAENQVQQLAAKHNIELTIFRPTMIYGYGQGQLVRQLG